MLHAPVTTVTISFYYKVGSPHTSTGTGAIIIDAFPAFRIAQKNYEKQLWLLDGGANITTYNTSVRDNGALSPDEFTLITYIYNGDTSSFDLYFGGKYYGICPMLINQAQTNQLQSSFKIGGHAADYYAKGEMTSLIICDHVLTIEEVMDIQDYATMVQPGANIKA